MSKGFKGIARIRSILECLALSRETKFKFKWAAFGIGCGFRCEINGVYVFITRRTYKFFNTAQDITYRWGRLRR